MSKTHQLCGTAWVWLAIGLGAGQAGAGVAVSPLKQEVSLPPGVPANVSITLSNHRRSPFDPVESVHLSVVDVDVREDGSIEFKEAGLMEDSASKWVSLSRTEATLAPGRSQVVECTILPPLAAPPGEYYTALMVTMDKKGRTDRGVVVQYRIASGIFVTVQGRTFSKQAKIERCEFLWPATCEASASRPAETQPAASQPAEAVLPRVCVLLHNVGRARFEASGKVRIVDARSRVVFAGRPASKRPCVFGGDSRVFEVPVTRILPAGKYVIKAEMDYESAWSKARYELPVEILPEQAQSLALLNKRYQAGRPPVEVDPESIALTVHAGAMRSLGLAMRNMSDGPLRGAAMVAASQGQMPDSWMTVQPGAFAVRKAGRKTIELKVRVPAGTAPGTYSSAVIVKAGPEGSAPLELRVPVEIEVKTER
jgi:hypothetical protein